jgi:hypothetical protein
MLNETIIPQNELRVTGSVDLSLILDTIDTTEADWRQMADPYPLLAEELRKDLCELLGVIDHDH